MNDFSSSRIETPVGPQPWRCGGLRPRLRWWWFSLAPHLDAHQAPEVRREETETHSERYQSAFLFSYAEI